MPKNSFELENTLEFKLLLTKKFSLICQLSQFGLFLSPSRFSLNVCRQRKFFVSIKCGDVKSNCISITFLFRFVAVFLQ